MADKLEERLRSTFAPFLRSGVFIPDSKRVAKLRNPDGPEAADEITRLNAENERLRLHCANYEATMRAIAESSDGAELARLNALVDEMREGLERVITHPAVELCDCGEPGCLTFDLRALITKASRDSGHG